MEIFQLDEQGCLFISPDIDDWEPVTQRGIDAIIDLDGEIDNGVPINPNNSLYIYLPFDDYKSLPDLDRLHAVAALGAMLVRSGRKVLAHCSMGHNRCALVAALILMYMGMTGAEAIERIQSKRQGALYNKTYSAYLINVTINEQRPTLVYRLSGT